VSWQQPVTGGAAQGCRTAPLPVYLIPALLTSLHAFNLPATVIITITLRPPAWWLPSLLLSTALSLTYRYWHCLISLVMLGRADVAEDVRLSRYTINCSCTPSAALSYCTCLQLVCLHMAGLHQALKAC
jgi:hypothetical protein